MNPLRTVRKRLGKLIRLVIGPVVDLMGVFRQGYITAITYWEGDLGDRLRSRYYKKRLGALGAGSRLDVGVRFECPERIFIGDRVHLDRFCYLVAAPSDLDLSRRDLLMVSERGDVEKGTLSIDDDCHISQGTMIFAHGGVRIESLVTLSAGARIYSLSSLPDSPTKPGSWSSLQPYSGSSPTVIGPVVLERNVWLGLDVLVFPGVVIGEDSFVRSRSVVTRSCQANSVLAGDPAQYKKPRFAEPKEETT